MLPVGRVGRGGLTGHNPEYHGREWARGGLYVFQHVQLHVSACFERGPVFTSLRGRPKLGQGGRRREETMIDSRRR